MRSVPDQTSNRLTCVWGWAMALFVASVTAESVAAADRSAPGASEPAARNAIEFLDTRTVEHVHFLERRVTPVQKYEKNPVIADGHSVQTILKDKDGRLRMWYVTRRKIPGHTGSGREYALRYAESTDGLDWRLPNLGLKEFDGNKENNVILKAYDSDAAGRKISGEQGVGNFCIVDREQAPAPNTRGRFTALIDDGSFAYSDDGLHWTAYPENPTFHPAGSDTYNNFLFDTRIGRYVLYHRPHPNIHAGWARVNRLVARIESDDLLNWDWNTARCVLDTHDGDAPAVRSDEDAGKRAKARGRDKQFYGMTVVQYQDFYLGFALLLDETKEGWMDVRLLHSFDGVDWHRESNDRPLIPSNPEFGHWDSGLISSLPTGSPTLIGDDLHFYYGAFNMTHNYTMRTDDKSVKMRIGLGTVKRGRLVGYHAGEDEGELLTRPFLLDKPRLLLNADAANGEVTASLAMEDGRPIPGFSKKEFQPIRQDGLDLPMRWSGKNDLAELVGKKIRVRIAAKNAALYALRMVEPGE